MLPRALVCAAVAALSVGSAGAAPRMLTPPDPGDDLDAITFSDTRADAIQLRGPSYRLTFRKRDGALVGIADARGRKLLDTNGCLWSAIPRAETDYIGGCSFRPTGESRFSYRWRDGTLTLTYAAGATAPRPVDAVVTVSPAPDHVDLRLTLTNRAGVLLEKVFFPADLVGAVADVTAGYAPTYLPGLRFSHAFFERLGSALFTYPSRWAFADYLSVDVGGSHVALSAVNPAPAPLAPAELGFVHNGEGTCFDRFFCLRHGFHTWFREGEWTSPVLRLRVGGDARRTILGYRGDNGIDGYPSLAQKVGGRLETLARAPLVKADLWKGLPPFAAWGPTLRRLPRPSLLHPVSFQPGGHDESFPDFLPPDPKWGSLDDFRRTVADGHGLGDLVMPYLNVSWWDDESPTLRAAGAPGPAALSVQDERGRAVVETFENKSGIVVSPNVPFVRQRTERLLEEWRTDVPADCLFFDQIGARVWQRDFNPAAPTRESYEDGWLTLFAPHASRCLMVEDGWDRLAQSFSGFHGGLLLGHRQHDEPNRLYGNDTWSAYPLATWLLHDKVLMYQHDLFEGTMTTDLEMLTWNAAFGFMLSYSWDGQSGTLDGPWLDLVGAFQRALGPRLAGKELTGWRDLATGVTESTFGDLKVVANWNSAPYELDGFSVAPHGFLARASDGFVAAALTGAGGVRYVVPR